MDSFARVVVFGFGALFLASWLVCAVTWLSLVSDRAAGKLKARSFGELLSLHPRDPARAKVKRFVIVWLVGVASIAIALMTGVSSGVLK